MNLLFVFLLTGIWHGAGFNYILWGAMNGVCVVGERCARDKKWYRSIPIWIKWAAAMLVVFISWIPFRLSGLSAVWQYLSIMLGVNRAAAIDLSWAYFFEFRTVVLMITAIAGATVFSWKGFVQFKEGAEKNSVLFVLQEVFLLGLAVIDVMCMVNSTYSPFLYFQY